MNTTHFCLCCGYDHEDRSSMICLEGYDRRKGIEAAQAELRSMSTDRPDSAQLTGSLWQIIDDLTPESSIDERYPGSELEALDLMQSAGELRSHCE